MLTRKQGLIFDAKGEIYYVHQAYRSRTIVNFTKINAENLQPSQVLKFHEKRPSELLTPLPGTPLDGA